MEEPSSTSNFDTPALVDVEALIAHASQPSSISIHSSSAAPPQHINISGVEATISPITLSSQIVNDSQIIVIYGTNGTQQIFTIPVASLKSGTSFNSQLITLPATQSSTLDNISKEVDDSKTHHIQNDNSVPSPVKEFDENLKVSADNQVPTSDSTNDQCVLLEAYTTEELINMAIDKAIDTIGSSTSPYLPQKYSPIAPDTPEARAHFESRIVLKPIEPTKKITIAENPELEYLDDVNIEEIRQYANFFKRKRVCMGLTQTQVGEMLSVDNKTVYSQSAISRFEKLDVTPKSGQKLKSILEKWLSQCNYKSVNSEEAVDSAMDQRRSRKKRTQFSAETTIFLNDYFEKITHPRGFQINEIANTLQLDREVVRVWFCNKRQLMKSKDNSDCPSAESMEKFFRNVSICGLQPISPDPFDEFSDSKNEEEEVISKILGRPGLAIVHLWFLSSRFSSRLLNNTVYLYIITKNIDACSCFILESNCKPVTPVKSSTPFNSSSENKSDLIHNEDVGFSSDMDLSAFKVYAMENILPIEFEEV